MGLVPHLPPALQDPYAPRLLEPQRFELQGRGVGLTQEPATNKLQGGQRHSWKPPGLVISGGITVSRLIL